MKLPDFEHLRQGHEDCPSDLTIDQWVAGELGEPEAQEVTAHVGSCAPCAERAEAFQAGFAAMTEDELQTHPERMLAGIRERLPASEAAEATEVAEASAPKVEAEPSLGQMLARWWRSLRGAWVPLAAAGAAATLFFVLRPTMPVDGPGNGVRVKGGLELHIYHQTDDGSEELVSGELLPPGNPVRFVVDLPEAGHTVILGVEADGEMYVAWPVPGSDTDTMLSAGERQILPGAVSFDEEPGSETLYLVHCPGASTAPRCTSRGADEAPSCPAGCVLTRFVVDKEL